MGISLVLFKRSSFNSKKIKKSFYLNLLNLSRKDFAMQKRSLKFNAFSTLLKGYSKKSEKISKETGPIRPWIRIYFLNQEIQYQIYKNHRFSNKNSRVFEKITKISLFGELNIIYFVLNKFFIKLRNSSTLKSEIRKVNQTYIYERSIYKKVSNSCFNKNLFFLNVNSFKSWFFYFFNKKNKNVHLSQTFIKNLKALYSDEEFYRSSTLLYKNIKTFSQIQFLNSKYSKLNKDKIFDSPNFSRRNFQLNYRPLFIKKNNNNNQLIVFRKVTKRYNKSNFVNSQSRKKSSFLIKKLFYKAYFFNFLQTCLKTQSYFKVMPMDRNQKSIPSLNHKAPKSNKTKLKTRKFLNLGKLSLDRFTLQNQDDDSLFLKKITKFNFEVMKNKSLLKQNVSIFIKLTKLLECLSFEPKFLLYLRCGTKNLVLNKQSYLEIKLKKQVEILKKKKIIQSYSLLNSNFLNIGSSYLNSKNIFRFKNRFEFPQYYFREKTKIKKFISKGKNRNLSYFPNLLALNNKILREFLIDSKELKNLKNIKNLFPKFTESVFLDKKKNDFFLNLTFYKLFLEIHENLYFLRQSKNYFLLKLLTLKFDSIFKNYLLSKKTFNVINTINYKFVSNLELFKVYRKLKNFLLHFYQTKKKKLNKANSLYLTNINFKFFLSKKLTDLSVLLILTHCSNKKLLKLKKKTFKNFFKKNDLSNFYFLWLINCRKFRQLKIFSCSKLNDTIYEQKVYKVFKEMNLIKKLFFYRKSITLVTLNLSKILKENRIYYSSFSKNGVLVILIRDNTFYKKENDVIPIKELLPNLSFLVGLKSYLTYVAKLNNLNSKDNFRFEFNTKRFLLNCAKNQFQVFFKKIECSFCIYRYKLLINNLQNKRVPQRAAFLLSSKLGFADTKNFINLEKLSFFYKVLDKVIFVILKIQRVQFKNQLNQSFFSYGQNFLFFATNSNFLYKNTINFLTIFSNLNLRIKKTNFFYTSSNMGQNYFSPNHPSFLKPLNSLVKLYSPINQNKSDNLKSLPGFVFYGFYIVQRFKTKSFLNSIFSFQFRKKRDLNLLVISSLEFKNNLFLFEDSLPKFFTKKEIPFLKSFKKNDKFGFFELFVLPSTLNLKNHTNQIKTLIFKSQGKSQLFFIKKLAPIITKWSHYYKFENQSEAMIHFQGMKKTLKNLNFLLVKRLWKWSFKRHNKMSNIWIKSKYFVSINNQKALFSTKMSFAINKIDRKPFISKLPEPKFRSNKNKNSIHFSKIKLVFIVLPKYY